MHPLMRCYRIAPYDTFEIVMTCHECHSPDDTVINCFEHSVGLIYQVFCEKCDIARDLDETETAIILDFMGLE